jgi:membrane fusion protein (multidrug efflux system)
MKKKSIIYGILAVVLVVVGIAGFNYYRFLSTHENTDDAQIDGNIVPVIAKVGAYVNTIHITDNQLVHKGDLLVELDAAELQAKVEQAEAAVENAAAAVAVARSAQNDVALSKQLAQTGIESPKTNLWKAQNEYKRYKDLYDEKLATPQQLDNVKAALENAQAQYDLAKQRYGAAGVQQQTALNQVKVAEANLHQKQKDLEYAKLQLSYTKIYAPASGTVSKRSIQAGQLVSPGQPMMSLVQDSDIWLTANFKETQMEGIKQNCAVNIKVDAYPHLQVQGTVESIGAATGAKFSLLPPDNASGNFVKVVQRVPVRIHINQNKETADLLKPGLSVTVEVEKAL